jgi:hypothetical protein
MNESVQLTYNYFLVKAASKYDQARLHPTNDGTHIRGSSVAPPGIIPFMLTLLLRLITHHSAPHKKVTAVKDGHALTQDLINWRSRVLAASDAPQSDRLGSGKERSRGAGGISGRLF